MRLVEFDEDKPLSTALDKLRINSWNPPEDEWGKVCSYIYAHCKQILNLYLNETSGGMLFSGLPTTRGTPVISGMSPENRLPKDTPTRVQFGVDRHLKAMGFTALRSNSLYTTGSERTAKNYGNGIPYAIFPVDGFSFTWSPRIPDMYETYTMNEYGFDADLRMPSQSFVELWEFDRTRLVDAITSHNEVLIHGKYVGVNGSYDNIKRVMGWVIKQNANPTA